MAENKQFNTRAYNSIQRLPFGLIEKSSTSARLDDEANYYSHIPQDVSFLFPRKINYGNVNNIYRLTLEYYPYRTLGEHLISDEYFEWDIAFENIKNAIHVMSLHQKKTDKISLYATQMYIDKTYNEYLNFVKMYHDKTLFDSKKLLIHDLEYDNFESIWDKIKSAIDSNLMDFSFRMIHGDMCFSNILYHPETGVRFIDMRGSFGERGIYGDVLYDYAKLLHSVEGGYELIINDLFDVIKNKQADYFFYFVKSENKTKALNSYLNVFSDKNIHLIRLIQGLIYVGMCARHYDSESRQLIMYLTGIKSLNEAFKGLC